VNARYDDIEDRLGKPLWWDQHGCPRYARFAPELVTVYAQVASLIEVACQACSKRFTVGQPGLTAGEIVMSTALQGLTKADFERNLQRFPLEYGDVQGHGRCAGETMTTDLIRVLELWSREKGAWQLVPRRRWPKEAR